MKWVSVCALVFMLIVGCTADVGNTTAKGGREMLKGKKILMLIAQEDFRDEELLVPKEIFTNEGATVVVASVDTTEAVGMLGTKVKPDIALKDVSADDYDAVVFVGGRGCIGYWDHSLAHRLALNAYVKNKVIGAICFAPVILANAGVLQGKKATVFRTGSSLDAFERNGVTYCEEGVVVEGNMVTARGPEVAKEFALALVNILSKGQ